MRVVNIDEALANLQPHIELNDVLRSGMFIKDVTGMPLNSDRGDNVPPEIDFDYLPCPYSDSPSRYPGGEPHEIMMSGLEKHRLYESYGAIRGLTLAMRDAYLEGKPADYQLTVLDGLNILAALQYLPKYLVNRAKNPVEIDQLPQHIVVGANCASGAIGATGAFARGNIFQYLPPAEQLLDAAERVGSMVGTKTVCVAPPRLILDYLEMIRLGKPVAHGDVEAESQGLLKTSEVRAAIMFGTNIDQIAPLINVLLGVDSAVAAQLGKYKPGKHNPRQIMPAIKTLELHIQETISHLKRISASVNFALGRNFEQEDDFSAIIQKNAFGLKTVKLAKAKRITINYK